MSMMVLVSLVAAYPYSQASLTVSPTLVEGHILKELTSKQARCQQEAATRP